VSLLCKAPEVKIADRIEAKGTHVVTISQGSYGDTRSRAFDKEREAEEGLEQIFVFRFPLPRLSRFLDWGRGGTGTVLGIVATIGKAARLIGDGDIGDLFDDVDEEIELILVDDGLFEVAGSDAFAVALPGLIGSFIAQGNHEKFEGFGHDDRSDLEIEHNKPCLAFFFRGWCAGRSREFGGVH